MSARKVVADTLKVLCKRQRGRRYFVKRGVIEWATFDFGAHPRAIGIMFDEIEILRESGMYDAQVTLEMGVALPSAQEPVEVDDGLLDELIEDAEEILKALQQAANGSTEPVIFKLATQTARVREWHDVDLRVQGVVASVTIGY